MDSDWIGSPISLRLGVVAFCSLVIFMNLRSKFFKCLETCCIIPFGNYFLFPLSQKLCRLFFMAIEFYDRYNIFHEIFGDVANICIKIMIKFSGKNIRDSRHGRVSNYYHSQKAHRILKVSAKPSKMVVGCLRPAPLRRKGEFGLAT